MTNKLATYLTAFKVYLTPRMLSIFCLGVASGLPLPLVIGTLDIRLAEEGISKTAIGLFAFVSTPYALKFIWAPLLDRLPIPGLTNRVGQRRGWLLVTQALLMAALVMLGLSNPTENLALTAFWAVIVSFLSASHDVVIDAYRIEITPEEEQGAGAASIVYGYHTSMRLIGGTLALVLADHISWSIVYSIMAVFILIGTAAMWVQGEPKTERHLVEHHSLMDYLRDMLFAPFKRFVAQNGWVWFLMLVVLFKLCDAFAGKMTGPFLLEMGFSKTEYGIIIKTYGLIPSLLGTAIGGVLVYKIGMIRALWVTGILQILSNLTFIWQAYAGHDAAVLAVVIGIENFSSGLGAAALVAFISSLCDREFTATHYALFSSLAVMGRTFLSSTSGWFADHVSWPEFFLLSALTGIPALIVLFLFQRWQRNQNTNGTS